MNKYHIDNKVNRRCAKIMRLLDHPRTQTDIMLTANIDGYQVMNCLQILVDRGLVIKTGVTDYHFVLRVNVTK